MNVPVFRNGMKALLQAEGRAGHAESIARLYLKTGKTTLSAGGSGIFPRAPLKVAGKSFKCAGSPFR